MFIFCQFVLQHLNFLLLFSHFVLYLYAFALVPFIDGVLIAL